MIFEIKTFVFQGILVASEPPDGCMAIKQRPYFPNDFNITINVFVLIRRGTCDFAVKVS